MSWSHALLGGKDRPREETSESETDGQTDTWTDRHTQRRVGRRERGERRGGDKKGSVRAGVHGGMVARRPAPPAGTGAAMAVPFSRAGQSLSSPTPAPAPPRGDGARPGPLRPPRRWDQRQQRRDPTLLVRKLVRREPGRWGGRMLTNPPGMGRGLLHTPHTHLAPATAGWAGGHGQILHGEGSEDKSATENSWSGHSSEGTGGCQGPGDRCCHGMPRGGGKGGDSDTGQPGPCSLWPLGKGSWWPPWRAWGQEMVPGPSGLLAQPFWLVFAPLEWGTEGHHHPPRPHLSLMLQGCENPRALVSCWGEAGRETPALRMDPIRGRATNQPGTILVVVTTNGTRVAPTRHQSSWGGGRGQRGLSPPARVGGGRGDEVPILLMRHWPKLHKITPTPATAPESWEQPPVCPTGFMDPTE